MRTTTFSEFCPHCGKLVWCDTDERQISFGNTVAICEHCGQSYLDGKVFEWVNLNNEQKKAVLVLGPDMTIMTEAELRKNYSISKYMKVLILTLPLIA